MKEAEPLRIEVSPTPIPKLGLLKQRVCRIIDWLASANERGQATTIHDRLCRDRLEVYQGTLSWPSITSPDSTANPWPRKSMPAAGIRLWSRGYISSPSGGVRQSRMSSPSTANDEMTC